MESYMNVSTATDSNRIKGTLSTTTEVALKLDNKSPAASPFSEKMKQTANTISEFFENHTTTRKIIAHVPNTLFRVALIADTFTSYKLFPESRYFRVISYILILGFCDSVRDFDSYLAKKKIEHTN